MRYYGKYEKRPEAKNLMLQIYFTSLLCLVLCVTMFFGTTYACFTSEVSNTGNEIYVGRLDVGLYRVSDGAEVDLDSSESGETNPNKLFDKTIPWEPGRMEFRTIKITNEGNLAFDYVLSFVYPPQEGTVTTATAEAETAVKVEEYFEVWVHKGKAEAAAYEEMTQADSGWTPAGTLAELLAGKNVLAGELTANYNSGDAVANTETTPEIPAHTYTIALRMMDDVEYSSVKDKNVTFNVKLVAYQQGHVPETTEATGTVDPTAEGDANA